MSVKDPILIKRVQTHSPEWEATADIIMYIARVWDQD